MAAAGSFALAGRVVTMAPGKTPLGAGVVYVAGNSIVAVLDSAQAPPPGFGAITPIATNGTIYPGLIELHNHLSYDVLPLWQVPHRFTNRGGWSVGPTYRTLISGPMGILGQTAGLPEAVVRYVEAKALLGGTTTSQGVALYSDPAMRTLYFGAARNVERTEDPDLPIAATRIGDVEARDAAKFLVEEQLATSLLLHLAEGSDLVAENHFKALHQPPPLDRWAIAPSLAGIHCVPLVQADFDVLAAHGASMIWSPLSNLLLYGRTADIAAARAAGVRVGIGSDWSPSGSKNLLAELKVARFVGGIADRDLLAMATIDAAAILRWQATLGSLEAGKRADLIVVVGTADDPYGHLFTARETDIELVMIDGVVRVATSALMTALQPGVPTESLAVGSTTRQLNLAQVGVNPAIAALSVGAARERLTTALATLPDLWSPTHAIAPERPAFTLELDHEPMEGYSLRPELPDRHGAPTGLLPIDASLATPTAALLQPIALDALTVVDDANYLTILASETNLPAGLRAQFAAMS